MGDVEEKGLGKQVITKGLGSPMTKGTGMRSKASGTGEVEMIRTRRVDTWGEERARNAEVLPSEGSGSDMNRIEEVLGGGTLKA